MWNRSGNLKRIAVLAAACVIVNGCGGGKKQDGGYDFSQEAIFTNGCLNLGNFYGSLQRMPDDAMVRAFTYDFEAASKEQDGSAPANSRLRVLTRAAYFYSESKPKEIRSTWASASQSECSSGSLVDGYGNATPFTVEEYQDNWIKVKLSDESTHKFILTSERSMRIISEEFRGSQCIYHSPLKTTTETALHWGPSGELSSDETVDAHYMSVLSQAVPEAPAALRSSVAEATTDSISLATAVLRDMNAMEVNPRDQQDCPRKNKPPEVDPLPTPEATPVPEATPIPEASPAPEPQPIPEATPAPVPTPEI